MDPRPRAKGGKATPESPSRPEERPVPSSDGFIKETQAFWGGRYGRDISPRQAEEITHNIASFFDLLERWDREEHEEKAQTKAKPSKRKSGHE